MEELFQPDRPETVKVVGPFEGGFMIINKSDFDPAVHELFTDAPPMKAAAPKKGKE